MISSYVQCTFTRPFLAAHDILVIVLVSLIAVQMPVMFFASFWPSLSRNATWGKLMVYYHRAVEKMDVARGRTVPLPPFTGHKDKERVLESLNPYDANASLALLMDFLAMKHGVGLTLKTLCFLEGTFSRASHLTGGEKVWN